MKNFRTRVAVVVSLVVVVGVNGFVGRSWAQVNSWTSLTSGNWEDASWSLGIIPGTNQTILLTNSGFKAVQISPTTAQNFPQSLNVNSIVISSPTNSFNTLLMNFAGLARPLTVQSLSVASNSAMTMLSSALQLNGPNGVGMTIGGQFNQTDSVVAGNQINVGYIGPGIYNLNSGILDISQLWIGGPFQGVFNQNGGTNAFGITHLDGGEYVLSNGFFGAAIYFDNGGEFRQQGGLLQSNLTIFQGNYTLAGGIHEGDTSVPSTDGVNSGHGGVLQSGGTNYGSLDIGSYGPGSYTLSNGVSFAGSLLVDYAGSYDQWGGVQTVTGTIDVAERQIAQNAFSLGIFHLNAGQISSQSLSVEGYYTQSGGTNAIIGDLTTQGVEADLLLSNGVFTANNIIANAASVGGIFLRGGGLVVTNDLRIGAYIYFPDWQGFAGSSGRLIVSNILVASGGSFACGACTIVQSGTLTLTNASLYAGSGSQQFGRFLLSDGGNTNSTLFMPSGTSIVHFGDSSSVTWSNDPVLTVENWSGSLSGGGQQQIVFGNGAGALTAQQLGQIQFHNPTGLSSNIYPARILATGEIVPDSGASRRASMALHPQTNGMQVTLQGAAGRTYSIEISTDLVHWQAWTSQLDASGTFSITDTTTTSVPSRFYRAKLLP